jgi:hypothetical protein
MSSTAPASSPRQFREHADCCSRFLPAETLHLEPVSGLLFCGGCRPANQNALTGQSFRPTSRRPAGSR